MIANTGHEIAPIATPNAWNAPLNIGKIRIIVLIGLIRSLKAIFTRFNALLSI